MTQWVAIPNAAAILTYAGLPTDDVELQALANNHVAAWVDLAVLHTRGRGFQMDGGAYPPGFCEPPLVRVLTSATVRSMTNPVGLRRVEIGGFSSLPSDSGWSLVELTVLNSYRQRVG